MLSYHRVSLIDQAGTRLGDYDDRAPTTNPVEYPDCDPWLFGLGFTLTFRKQLCLADDFWSLSKDFYDTQQHLAHDQWFFFLALAFGKIFYIDDSLALYRQHGRNLFGAGTANHSGSPSYQERMLRRYRKNLSYADACESNIRILSELVSLVDHQQIQRIERMIERYHTLGKMFRLSANISEDYSLTKKLYDVWQLQSLGSYRKSETWSFERRDPIRDLITCIVSRRANHRDEA